MFFYRLFKENYNPLCRGHTDTVFIIRILELWSVRHTKYYTKCYNFRNPVVKFIYNDAEVFSAKLTNYTNNFQYTLPVGELRIFVLEESTKPQMYLKHYEFTIDIPGNIGVISPVHEHISVSDESRMVCICMHVIFFQFSIFFFLFMLFKK